MSARTVSEWQSIFNKERTLEGYEEAIVADLRAAEEDSKRLREELEDIKRELHEEIAVEKLVEAELADYRAYYENVQERNWIIAVPSLAKIIQRIEARRKEKGDD